MLLGKSIPLAIPLSKLTSSEQRSFYLLLHWICPFFICLWWWLQLGLDSLHLARIDYQDREKRKAEKSLEFVWRGSKTLASSSQIFTNVFLVHYSPPTGFHYEVTDDYVPLQDDPRFDGYNIKDTVANFVNASLVYVSLIIFDACG